MNGRKIADEMKAGATGAGIPVGCLGLSLGRTVLFMPVCRGTAERKVQTKSPEDHLIFRTFYMEYRGVLIK